MRPFFVFILTFLFGISHGQGFSYPSINRKGQYLVDFVPGGWTVLDSAKGDLNKDEINDGAIILQYRDSITLINQDKDTLVTQPRILLILFKNYAENYFYLVEQSNSFILNHDNSAMDDPYQQLTINNELLEIDFTIFYNMGSWYVTNASYKFRYQRGQFVLIGADYSSFHRATHEYEDYSYNFLTKKRKLTKGNDNEETEKTYWKTLKIPALKTLKTLKQPFSWQIEDDVYL